MQRCTSKLRAERQLTQPTKAGWMQIRQSVSKNGPTPSRMPGKVNSNCINTSCQSWVASKPGLCQHWLPGVTPKLLQKSCSGQTSLPAVCLHVIEAHAEGLPMFVRSSGGRAWPACQDLDLQDASRHRRLGGNPSFDSCVKMLHIINQTASQRLASGMPCVS